MKRLNILMASCLALVLFSCKKNDITSPDEMANTSKSTDIDQSRDFCGNYSITLESYELNTLTLTTTFIWKIVNANPKTMKDVQQWQLTGVKSTAVVSLMAVYYGSTIETNNQISPLPAYTTDTNGCSGSPAFTIKSGTIGGGPTYYRFVFNGLFEQGTVQVYLSPKGSSVCCLKWIGGVGNQMIYR
jgi:hypothetical protein